MIGTWWGLGSFLDFTISGGEKQTLSWRVWSWNISLRVKAHHHQIVSLGD